MRAKLLFYAVTKFLSRLLRLHVFFYFGRRRTERVCMTAKGVMYISDEQEKRKIKL